MKNHMLKASIDFQVNETSAFSEFIIFDKKMQLTTKKQTIRLKVCVIGSHEVGKTSLIRILTDSPEYVQGPQYQVYMYCSQSSRFSLQVQLWDCGNHMSFHKYMREAYFRDASASLLLVDISKPDWKEDAHKWIAQAYEHQCYLVHALAMNRDIVQHSSQQKQGLTQKINKNKVSKLQEQAHQFFHKYDIRLNFYERGPQVKQQFRNIFVKMYDEYLVVSRGSLARGLYTFDPNGQDGQIFQQTFIDKQ